MTNAHRAATIRTIACVATLAVCAATVVVMTGASPAGSGIPPTHGELTQKGGTAGCISDDGTGGDCADGTALANTRSVAVSPDGENVYAANFEAVVVFDRNPATGALTQKPGTAGCISDDGSGGACADGTEIAGESVAVSPDGANVYVAAPSPFNAVLVFNRDPADGELAQKLGTAGCISETGSGGACADGTALEEIFSLVVSPDGRNVYAAAGNSEAVVVFDRDPAGALTQKAGTAGCVSDDGSGGLCVDGRALASPQSVTVSPDGRNVYAGSIGSASVAVFDRNPSTGALTQKAGTAGCWSDDGSDGCNDGTEVDGWSVAVSPDGENAYVAGSDAVAVFDRNPTTGALTQMGGAAGCISDSGSSGACVDGTALNGAESVVVAPDGRNAYVAAATSDAVAVFDRDLGTGVLTQKLGSTGCWSETGAGCRNGRALDAASAVALSPNGLNAYVAANNSDAVAVFDVTCLLHPFSDVPAWVTEAVAWAYCGPYMTGYANNTFRGDLDITRAQVARLLYRVAGSPDVGPLDPHGLTDVPAWVEEPVRWLLHHDYATGYPNDTFRPNRPISRGQVTRMLYRIAGSPGGSPANTFTDVPPWVSAAVDWIVDPTNVPPGPYATGYGNNTYRPNLAITRAQVTRMTCRAETGVINC